MAAAVKATSTTMETATAVKSAPTKARISAG